jgi:creatinine amidohydrolase
MRKTFMEEMTWEEFKGAVDDTTVAVIPLGSTELEGTHLPLGVDTIVARGVSQALAGEKGVVVGPALPIGYSKWFMPFPGTLSLESDTLTRVLMEYTNGLSAHGIRRIVFLNSHRGNNACVEAVARTLVQTRHIRVGMLSIWKLANDLIAKKPSLIAEGRFTHAGEIMTSVVMALKPDTVVTSRMKSDSLTSPENSPFTVKNSLGETEFKGSVQMIYPDIREITDTGIMGDPSTATPEKGTAVLALITDYIRDFLQAFRKLPLPEIRK